ncbi:MAG: SUMF1/EgtB/PvdO family nonheme iron enzyme [Planctomycetes bacterium]|nr:SUMF1/EgtB/PvdO family nonheme iron enzyme [Planctomycetota bacterium]
MTPGERFHARTGIRLLLLPPGAYLMGSPEGEKGRCADETPHGVRLARPFLLGKHPVTNAEFRRFRPGHSSGPGFDEPEQPAVRVSWDDAAGFCAWAGLRLPTEAEWEYAVRGGGGECERLFPWGDAWPPPAEACHWAGCACAYAGRTAPVGRHGTNPFGACDLAGNVAEWCGNFYGEYPTSPESAPAGPAAGNGRVLRGGSWLTVKRGSFRCARRDWAPAQRRLPGIGFRVAGWA